MVLKQEKQNFEFCLYLWLELKSKNTKKVGTKFYKFKSQMLINEYHSPLFCIVKISLFGVLTTIIFNAQTSQCST